MPIFVKKREKEFEHKVLEILNRRLELESTYKWRLIFWDKGYDAESGFDGCIIKLSSDCLVISGLYINVDGNEYQIDSILIFPNRVLVAELKNYEGEYEYKNHQFYRVATNYEIRDPFYQIDKNQTAIRQLLYKNRLDMKVDGALIFWNPEFTLYNAPKKPELILPSKVPSLLKDLNEETGRITESQKRAAQFISAQHIVKRKKDKLPDYTYEELKKGITCVRCGRMTKNSSQRTIYCPHCHYKETMQSALVRMTKELDLLRINEKFILTSSILRDYCGGMPTRFQLESFLRKYTHPVTKGERYKLCFPDIKS